MAEYGFLDNPWFQMGAGIMGASQPGVPGMTAIGQGILGGVANLQRQRQLEILAETQRQKAAAAGAADYSKTPTYFWDPTTEQYRVGQLSPTGELHFPEVPENLRVARPLTQLDLGSGIQLRGQGQTEPVATVPKGIPPTAEPALKGRQAAEAAAGRVRGEREQTAKMELPQAKMGLENITRYIEELKAHPGLGAGTGFSSMAPVVPGSDRADFEARKEQLLGGAFLQAYQELKGGGHITEIEGQKAEQSLVRMKAAVSEEDFVAALDDYLTIVRQGYNRRRMTAGQPPVEFSGPGDRRGQVLKGKERRQRINQILNKYPAGP